MRCGDTVLLPAVLRTDDHSPELADLLILATGCASRVGARGSFPQLDALANSGGRKRVAVEARRLRRTLTG